MKPVSQAEVVRVFDRNLGNLRSLVVEIIKTLPEERGCGCGSALKHARLSG